MGEHDPAKDPIYDVLFAKGLSSFAILDAAKVPNLAEMLDMSGLTHRCLYTGQAAEDLAAFAPWLVELKPEAKFTQNLLTDSDAPAPWHMWGYEPGVFVQSKLDFDAVWRHLRKFTQAPSEAPAETGTETETGAETGNPSAPKPQQGKKFLIRFWDPDFLLTYLRQPVAPDTPLIQSFFRPEVIETFLSFNVFDGVTKVTFHPDRPGWTLPRQPSFDPEKIDRIGIELSDRRSARSFARDYPAILNDVSMPDIRDRISRARGTSKFIGITRPELLGTFVLLDVVYAPGFWSSDDFGAFWTTNRLPPDRRFQAYLDVFKAEAAKSVPDFKAWW